MKAPVAKAGDISYSSVYGDGSYAMNAASTQKDAALLLLKFLAGPETATMHINVLKAVSAIPGANASSDPFISKILNFQTNSTPYIMVSGFRYGNPTGSAEITASLQGMFGGELAPADVAKRLQDAVATWHTPFQK
jgi:raffinose/stachyose/melibiose transport system substrate-binding protein